MLKRKFLNNPKKINLGILILSGGIGGAEEFVHKLASGIDREKFRLYLYVNEFLESKYSGIEGIQLVKLGKLRSQNKLFKIFDLIRIRNSLVSHMQENNIEVLHSQLENSLLALCLDIERLPCKLIFRLSGEEINIFLSPRSIENRMIKNILKRVFLSSEATTVTVSSWLVREIKSRYKANMFLIPNGVDTKLFKPMRLKKKRKTILFVGRYVEGKGVEDILTVAKRLRSYSFWFAGKGPLGTCLTLENTCDLGFQGQESLAKLYNQSEVCVFPSHKEAFGNAALEAMACGAKVVVTQVGFVDYVENNKDGLVVPVGRTDLIETSIIKVMNNDKLAQKLSRNAVEKARSMSLGKMVSSYEDLYLKIAKV